MAFYPYGGRYDRFGYACRNELLEAKPVNPLPQNAEIADCGDAGRDGYSVLSRANRITGERNISHTEPEFEGPKLEDY